MRSRVIPTTTTMPPRRRRNQVDKVGMALATGPVTVEELLPAVGSASDADTVAVFVNVPPTPACTVTSMVAVPPLASAPSEQFSGAVPLQEPVDGVALT